MKIIRNNIIPFGRYGAINLFGVLFAKRDMKIDSSVLQHEEIHTAQMRELGFLPFYVCYVLEWLFRLVQKHFDFYTAYKAISFEREAYCNQGKAEYLSRRPHYAQWRHS